MIDEEIALVRRVRPTDPPEDPAAKARAWARLQAEFTPAPRRRVRRGLWLAVPGAVAAGVAIAVVASQTAGPGPAPQTRLDTTKTLELAAQTVENQSYVPLRPRPDQWVYTVEMRNYALDNGDDATMRHGRIKVEEWWRFDGAAMASSVGGEPLAVDRIFSSLDIRKRPRPIPGLHTTGGIGGPSIVNSTPHKTYAYVAALPDDPDALIARIRHLEGKRDATVFGKISQLFRDDHLMPPKSKATLYRALARFPGVYVVPNVKDFAGRTGIAVTVDDDGRRDQIILNPRTYDYMGERVTALRDRTVTTRPDPKGPPKVQVVEHAGQVVTDEATLGSRVVDDAGRRG